MGGLAETLCCPEWPEELEGVGAHCGAGIGVVWRGMLKMQFNETEILDGQGAWATTGCKTSGTPWSNC